MIPNEIKQSFLDKAHREIDFPAYLDDLALATLDTHMPANHRRLGRPLPYQQANGAWAHPQTIAFKKRPSLINSTKVKLILSGISTTFAMLSQIQG